MLARQIVVGFGIAAIFPWLIYYGVGIFFPPPKVQNYYAAIQPGPAATTEERAAFANKQQEEQKAYASAARLFARVLFTVGTIAGVAAILVGAYVTSHAIGAGLIFGGISSLATGYWSYASYLDSWIGFVLLVVAFVALLFVGHRRLPQP
jgi:hypothetical protein